MVYAHDLKEKALTLGTALVTVLLGRWSPAIQILLVLMAMDYLSGMILAWQKKELSSRIGFIGVSKKIMLLSLVALGHQMDLLLGGELMRDACAMFYALNEALSIAENCAGIGLPLPPALLKALKALQEKN